MIRWMLSTNYLIYHGGIDLYYQENTMSKSMNHTRKYSNKNLLFGSDFSKAFDKLRLESFDSFNCTEMNDIKLVDSKNCELILK